MDTIAVIDVVVLFFLVLFGVGVSFAYLVGRRGGQISAQDQNNLQPQGESKLPERYVRELQQCMELSVHADREADALNAVIAKQKPAVAQSVANAVEQFVKTARGLSDQVNKIGSEAELRLPAVDLTRALTESGALATSEATLESDRLVDAEIESALAAHKNEHLAASPFEDARAFKRSSFRGAVKATIYPVQPGPGRDPVQCVVLTRDLSCGGIGIAHTDQLLPKQIVVIDAIGKLLVGEVRWCRREDENFYVAGCRLVKTNV